MGEAEPPDVESDVGMDGALMSVDGLTDVTTDALLGGRVRLYQPRHGYRVAIDPVFLAAAVPVVRGDRVLDVGRGLYALQSRVLHNQVVHKGIVHGNVHVLVDCRRDQESAVPLVI